MYIAIGIAAALFAADRILKYLSRTGKMKWEIQNVHKNNLDKRRIYLLLRQNH